MLLVCCNQLASCEIPTQKKKAISGLPSTAPDPVSRTENYQVKVTGTVPLIAPVVVTLVLNVGSAT